MANPSPSSSLLTNNSNAIEMEAAWESQNAAKSAKHTETRALSPTSDQADAKGKDGVAQTTPARHRQHTEG